MSAKVIARDLEQTLKNHGINVAMKAKEGGWMGPSTIEFEYEGEPKVLSFYDGEPSQVRKVARALLSDVATIFGRQDIVPAER